MLRASALLVEPRKYSDKGLITGAGQTDPTIYGLEEEALANFKKSWVSESLNLSSQNPSLNQFLLNHDLLINIFTTNPISVFVEEKTDNVTESRIKVVGR